jgi:NADH-quinone oxidoreductase subunit I
MPYRVPDDRALSAPERLYLPEVIRGLAITAGHFLRNVFTRRDRSTDILARRGPSRVSTVQYPEETAPYPPGYRGLHRLVPRDDGRPRCVACYMCATVCPAQCIYIEAGEYPVQSDKESAVIEKYPTRFVIDELRCVVCGFCVEACPKDAIRMDTATHAPPAYARAGFLWDVPKLLTGKAVCHPSDPWEVRDSSRAPEAHKEAHTRIAISGRDES